MQRAEFHYDLPAELIAQAPPASRASSRLLKLDGESGVIEDRRFPDLLPWLKAGDLLVINDTRVLPARLGGRKETGGKVELLLERQLGEREGRFQLRASRSPGPGSRIMLDAGVEATVTGRSGDLFDLAFECDLIDLLQTHGAVPLPPYIEREPEAADTDRYQTVYAAAPGAVAAPTAGLHFDQAMLDAVIERGVEIGRLTLHVGAGTFSPVRSENIEEHRLHAERVSISRGLCAQVGATRERGGRVVAVGTTSVRALESAAVRKFRPFEGETDLFIYPGFEFRAVDAIVTNFHLPESSLLMLVAAFAGHDNVMRAYRHAVTEKYRFFSYGDAMLVTGRGKGR